MEATPAPTPESQVTRILAGITGAILADTTEGILADTPAAILAAEGIIE